MQRVRFCFRCGHPWPASAGLAVIAGILLADDAIGQTRQRYTPRGRPPAATRETERDESGPDVTQLPAAPMPSLRAPNSAPNSIVKSPRPDLKDGEILVEEGMKLPAAQEVNAGNVLVKEAFKKSDVAKNEVDYSEIIAL